MVSDFSTVFLITKEPYIREPYYIGLLAIVAGIFWFSIQIRKRKTKVKGYFGSIFLMVWGLFFSGLLINGQISYNRLLDTYVSVYNNKRFELTEGIVNVQYRGKREGHDGGDIIVIAKKRFRLSHFTVTPAYHESVVYGGVLREGVYAKLYHHDGDILRIDIKDEHSATAFDGNSIDD